MRNVKKLQLKIIRLFYTGNYDNEDGVEIRKRFMHWVKTNRKSIEELKILRELWDAEEGDPEAQFSDEKFRDVMNRARRVQHEKGKTETRRKVSFGRKITRVAAVIIPLLIIGGVWIVTQDKTEPYVSSTFSVPNGRTENVKLPDSTQVIASAGSVVKFTQTGDNRRVELEGECFFQVAKDRKIPFVVSAEGVVVTVLGTEFNVEAYPDRGLSIITLAKGEVAVKTKAGEEFTITPNQRLIYNRESGSAEIEYLDDAYATIAGLKGKLICEQLTLPEMFKTIERHYNIEIEIDPSMVFDNSKYTTEFNHEVTFEIVVESWKLQTEKFDYVKVDQRKIKIIEPR